MLRQWFCSTLLAFSATAMAADSSDFKFAFHGFVGSSLYMQTSPDFALNGQGPLLLTSNGHASTFGADVRQSRMNFSVSGPMVFGATPTAVIETDFFGLNSPGNYGEVSVLPRLRLAYAELKWSESWTVRVGQDWELIFAQSALTQGHQAFPVNYYSGLVGWREPGVGVYWKSMVGATSNLEIAGQVLKSDWQNPYSFGQSTKAIANTDAGQTSGAPGVELRVKFTGDNYMAYVAGHSNHVGLNHANAQPYVDPSASPSPTATRSFDVQLVKLGGKYSMMGFTLALEAYSGKNLGPLIGNLNSFPVKSDVNETGGWAQLSYVWGNWTAAVDYGVATPKSGDVMNNQQVLKSNENMTLMAQYKEGNFAIAPEITMLRTEISSYPAAGSSGTTTSSQKVTGQQYMLTGNYYF